MASILMTDGAASGTQNQVTSASEPVLPMSPLKKKTIAGAEQQTPGADPVLLGSPTLSADWCM
ncbi:hypothetical protein [Labrenzia sp. OB1]|uniref:hypothetical protein n=1 Tax=Labrenzia sp. OB1 TaxID=1561204 RepID=UPI000B2C8BE6|nr:hypothetical protein [Labrenzia sp. OB1]